MSGLTDNQLGELSALLSREHVKTRKQGGRDVSYIEGWHVIAEANRIFGFDCWDRETVECRMVVERETKIGSSPQRDGWRVGYIAKVRIAVWVGEDRQPVRREGTGFGSGIDVDLGAAHESAIKEAETDAMKRALMTFGNPFGLALYDKTQAEVEPLPGRTATPPASRQNGAAHPTPQPQKHPRWDEANEAYTRIERAMNAAATPKMVDELIRANDIFLALIKDVSEPDYQNLMAASVARKQELMLSA